MSPMKLIMYLLYALQLIIKKIFPRLNKNYNMKSKSFLLNIVVISLITLFISCSNEDTYLNESEQVTQQGVVNNDAALITYGENNLIDSLTLDVVIPENEYGLSNTEPLLLFPFYKSVDLGSETWCPISNVQIEKNLKTYYSRSNSVELVLIAEKFDSSTPYGSMLEFKELNIIAVKPSRISGFTQNELDTRNYHEMIDFLSLNQ